MAGAMIGAASVSPYRQTGISVLHPQQDRLDLLPGTWIQVVEKFFTVSMCTAVLKGPER